MYRLLQRNGEKDLYRLAKQALKEDAWLKDGVFWTVLISVLGTVVAWLTGVMELQQALLTIATVHSTPGHL